MFNKIKNLGSGSGPGTSPGLNLGSLGSIGKKRLSKPSINPVIQTDTTNNQPDSNSSNSDWIKWFHERVEMTLARMRETNTYDSMPPSAKFIELVTWAMLCLRSLCKTIWQSLLALVNPLFSLGRKKKPENKPPTDDKTKFVGGNQEDYDQEDYDQEDFNQYTMIGGLIGSKNRLRYLSPLFMLSYFPAILTLAIVIFLIIFLVWVTIQTFISWISFGYLNLPDIPISFSRPTTQLVYSIFFVITSIFLIFFLLFARGLKMKTELDIIQIGKELIASTYILWPISVLIIGSSIAKAFYKMACSGDKTNLLIFAKLVESSVIFALGIAVLCKVILLIRPLRCATMRLPGISILLDSFSNMLARIIIFFIIYAALRLISLFIEDIISDKLVFFIAKLSKNVESPPQNCNEEETTDETQSELGKTMETIYMYVSGLIVVLILIVILVIQLPHPWTGSFVSANKSIGSLLQKIGFHSTSLIGETDSKKACPKKETNTEVPGVPGVPGALAGLTGLTGAPAGLPTELPAGAPAALTAALTGAPAALTGAPAAPAAAPAAPAAPAALAAPAAPATLVSQITRISQKAIEKANEKANERTNEKANERTKQVNETLDINTKRFGLKSALPTATTTVTGVPIATATTVPIGVPIDNQQKLK